jgi:hypothetical protein
MSAIILAIVYFALGYLIAALCYSGRERLAFEEGLRQGRQIPRDDAEVSLMGRNE